MSRQGLSGLIDRLQRAGLDFDGEDLADILWLAQQIQTADDRPSESIAPEPPPVGSSQPQPEPELPQLPELTEPLSEPIAPEPAAIAALPPPTIPDSSPSHSTTAPDGAIAPQLPPPDRPGGLPFRAPAAPALRHVRELEKALRPLTRKVPSPTAYELDEAATVEQVADRDWWMPVVRPAAERWLDVALVVEDSPAIALWERVIEDWQALLGRVGAFRDVRVWSLQSTEAGAITIAPRTSSQTAQGRSVSPKQLIDPSGQRLILFMSDCTSALWRAEPLQDVLKTWAASGSLALVQLLPERLWRRTALVAGYGVQLSATLPGQASDRLGVSGLPVWEEVETAGALRLPVVTIEPGPLARWARMVAGAGDAPSAGVLFEPGTVWRPRVAAGSDQPDPEAIVRQFWAVASPLAKELAGYLAAVPVSLDVLHLIQAALLPESNQVHAAEVFMGGLIERVGEDAAGLPIYDFREGVRSWLVGSMPRSQTEKVLDAVSEQIADRWGIAPRGFKALLLDSTDLPDGAIAEVQAFAKIARSTLLRMGGEFAALGDRLDPKVVGVTSSLPVYINPNKDWRKEEAGKLLVSDCQPYITVELPQPPPSTPTPSPTPYSPRESRPLARDSRSAITRSLAAKGLSPLLRRLRHKTATASFPPLIEISFEEGYLEPEEFSPNPEDLPEVSQEIVESPEFIQQEFVPQQQIQQEFIQQEFAQQQQIQTQQFAQQSIQTESLDPFADWELQEWSFETVRVDRRGQIIERLQKTARSHFVDLGGEVQLELVAIPSGQFQMGSPDEEAWRNSDEEPVRTVTVPPLLMSRYPITVQQWRRVAGSFPEVLNPKLNTDPSNWKDTTGPVERVSWFDAMEFCARLSKATDRLYRLPSEAEWEYGCRAGTQTPFAFGETLTTELANYDGNYTYTDGPKGEYRQQTTPVGQFPPNGFGLQDMHGNVWEWCLDDWHNNYQNAPVDGRPWFCNSTHERIFMRQFRESKQMDNAAFLNLTDVDNKQLKLLRGGSWLYDPWYCRSAGRLKRRADDRVVIVSDLSFRVVVLP